MPGLENAHVEIVRPRLVQCEWPARGHARMRGRALVCGGNRLDRSSRHGEVLAEDFGRERFSNVERWVCIAAAMRDIRRARRVCKENVLIRLRKRTLLTRCNGRSQGVGTAATRGRVGIMPRTRALRHGTARSTYIAQRDATVTDATAVGKARCVTNCRTLTVEALTRFQVEPIAHV